MLYTYSWNGLGQREGRKRLQVSFTVRQPTKVACDSFAQLRLPPARLNDQKGIMDHAVVGDGQPRFSDGLIYSDPCLLLGQSQKVIVDVGDGQSKEVTFGAFHLLAACTASLSAAYCGMAWLKIETKPAALDLQSAAATSTCASGLWTYWSSTCARSA